jgi:hypothetical protein
MIESSLMINQKREAVFIAASLLRPIPTWFAIGVIERIP